MKQYKKSRIQSLIRGFEILRCFTPDKPVLRLIDIADKIGISKATVFRYVSTLTDLGYLKKDEKFKGYKLTVKVMELGFAALNSINISKTAIPYLEELAHMCQEASSMAILDGSDVVYVARTATKRWMATNLQVGSKLPAYCTSLGRILLAYKPFEEVKEIYKSIKLISYTPYTIKNLENMKRDLETIRKYGYAINNQELEIGLLSAAAPVYDETGKVVAAINISMSSARVSLDELKQKFIPLLIKTANKISNALGYY